MVLTYFYFSVQSSLKFNLGVTKISVFTIQSNLLGKFVEDKSFASCTFSISNCVHFVLLGLLIVLQLVHTSRQKTLQINFLTLNDSQFFFFALTALILLFRIPWLLPKAPFPLTMPQMIYIF